MKNAQANKNGKMRLVAAVLFMAALFLAPSHTLLGKSGMKVETVELPGVSGALNNVAFAFERYVMVAPHMPEGVAKDEYDVAALTNHSLLLFDTKKPEAAPEVADLKPLYFPTKVMFDTTTQTAFVRGTVYKTDAETGDVDNFEAIAHLKVNLTVDQKPILNSQHTIVPIEGEEAGQLCTDAPSEMALGHAGKFLVFTNGSSIFTYNLDHGIIYKVGILGVGKRTLDYEISHLSIEEKTNTLSIVVSKREATEDGGVKHTSELHFYTLERDGTLTLISRCLSDKLPGVALNDGNNVAVSWIEGDQPGTYLAEHAYFIGNDGALYQVDLQHQLEDLSAEIKKLETFPDLASGDAENSTPRILKYDPLKRVLVVVKQGYRLRIARPFNGSRGRGGRIARPFNARVSQDAPAIVLVKFSKKNKVSSQKVFALEFEGEEGLSNFIYGDGSSGLISTFKGNLFEVRLADTFEASELNLLGSIGNRVEYVAYTSYRSSVVAINSFDLSNQGETLALGSTSGLSIVRLPDESISISNSVVQLLLPASSLVSTKGASIRRPYNLRR
jgi:hypothetical protein